MSSDGSQVSSTAALTPTFLADQLEDLERQLGETLSDVEHAAMREALDACPGTMARITKALRGMAGLFQSRSAEALGQRERELGSIVTRFGEGVRDLGEANARAIAGTGEQIEKLNAIAQMPPGAESIAQLRAVAMSVQGAAHKMAASLDAIAVQVENTTARLGALDNVPLHSAEPDLYDKATGLPSRVALDRRLADAIRRGGSWCFLLADVDRLGSINERFGRVVGDALVFKIASVAKARVDEEAGNAFIGCYTGGVFGIVMPGTLERGTDAAEGIRAAVAASRWQYMGQRADTVLATTVSIGLTQYRVGDAVEGLLRRAETALLRAKEEGRNRVVCQEP